jgi:predicted esterase
MEEASVDFQFKARYHKLGTIDSRTRQVWIVLHGYGQLARFFLKKFEPLAQQNVCVIAPEGLSRFYLSELTEQGRRDNKVGATWMTQENRLMDIDNYLAYLDAVYRKELFSLPNIPVTLLGFSQGCATVCRWATHGINFEKLILWAGIFPPDMDFKVGHDKLAAKKTYLVVGDQDPYLTPERMAEFDGLAQKLGIVPEKILFSGKHEMHEQTLLQLVQ